MLKRTISGALMAALTVVLIVLGALPFGIFMVIVSLIGVYEMAKAVGVHNRKKTVNLLEVAIYLATVGMYLVLMIGDTENMDANFIAVITAFILVVFAIYVFTYPLYKATDIMGTIFTVMYIPLMGSFLYRLRAFEDHCLIMTFLVLLVACGSDIFAYFVGSALGKHKLAPILSPKKSIEGAVGAVVCTSVVCTVYALALCAYDVVDVKYIWMFAIIGAVGSIVSQIGDLTASAIKRNYEIKDYGNLIPGHGGVMDRIDSILIVSPMIYLLAQWMFK